jgi:hypothetical protein
MGTTNFALRRSSVPGCSSTNSSSPPGWVVQDKSDLNLFAAQGIAVRESIMAAGHGRADYLLYVDKSRLA